MKYPWAGWRGGGGRHFMLAGRIHIKIRYPRTGSPLHAYPGEGNWCGEYCRVIGTPPIVSEDRTDPRCKGSVPGKTLREVIQKLRHAIARQTNPDFDKTVNRIKHGAKVHTSK